MFAVVSVSQSKELPVLVIGAGASGLVAARHCLSAGLSVEGIDRFGDVGGHWDIQNSESPVYRSAHLISSKRCTEVPDFPMPDDIPDYPSHEQVLKYWRDYAHHYQLYERYRFGVEVRSVQPREEGTWEADLSDGTTRRYQAVIAAPGKFWKGRFPHYPGTFTGTLLHSREYRDPMRFAGKRVLVIGAGNSGCDIAVDLVRVAHSVMHSTRRGYFYIPKYSFGRPSDVVAQPLSRLPLPPRWRTAIQQLLLRLVSGAPEQYGLPRPDHGLLESHPILNSHLPEYVAQGDIVVKPDVKRWNGTRVEFTDGSEAIADAVICATGYEFSAPFFAPGMLGPEGEPPRLWMHLFSPDYPTLALIGLPSPPSGSWWIYDAQAKLVATYLKVRAERPEAAAELREAIRATAESLKPRLRYVSSPRHTFEIDPHTYTKAIRKLERRCV